MLFGRGKGFRTPTDRVRVGNRFSDTRINRRFLKWRYITWFTLISKILKKQKNPLNSSNREEKVIEILLNCKVSYRNRSVTNQLPKFENLLIFGNKTAKMGLSHFVSLLCFLSVSFSDCKYKILVFANLLY